MKPGDNVKHLYSWHHHGEWKQRYSKFYACQLTKPKPEKPTRISFISNDEIAGPYLSLLGHMRDADVLNSPSVTSRGMGNTTEDDSGCSTSDSHRNSKLGNEIVVNPQSDLGGNETLLLDMVRARHREIAEEAQDKTLDLRRDDISDDDTSSEACIHGLSMRMTERSLSRSRVSRMSTRRDIDIPSILAFSTHVPAPVKLQIPAFGKVNVHQKDEVPRWSIRRSVCPVCSQKWKDRSSISNVKYSGLKRSSTMELPKVIAPARLRTSITLGYVPRPALAAVDEDAGMSHGGLRNTSAAWQLTRARRFRIPKPQMPPPEATMPPSSTAPLARKDLDQRVTRFLTDDAHRKRLA